jgi:phospholipid/cholesterol/gamma-HCH transport system ATP-binding protein
MRADSIENAIEVRGLQNRFGAQIVHQSLDLDLRRGEVLAVIGGSGAGKSVLLRSIVGLQEPSAGQIKVLGTDLRTATATARAAIERRWGVMFQDGALFSSLSVLENIEVPMLEHATLHSGAAQSGQPLPRDLIEEIAQLKISLVGLPPEAAYKMPSQLSGGMRKRAGIARALALDPEILFLDEPTSGLDPIGAADFDALIVTLKRSLDLTVFLVTHDLDSIFTCCDRVAVLADKYIVAIDTPARIAKQPHPWIQQCFGGPRGRSAEAAVHLNARAMAQT